MNKIILLFAVMVLISCNKKDSAIIDAIKLDVQASALGTDLNYKSISLDTIKTVFVKETLSRFPEIFTKDNITLDELRDRLDRYSKDGNDVLMGYFYERLDKLMKSNPDNVDYSIWKNTYQIYNPIFKQDVTVTNYYFFDSENKLIGKVSDSEFNKLSSEFGYPYPEIVKYENCMAVIKGFLKK